MKVNDVIILLIFLVLVVVLFRIPVKHTKTNSYNVTTKDAVEINVTVESTYGAEIVMLGNHKRLTNNMIDSKSNEVAVDFAKRFTSLEIYKLQGWINFFPIKSSYFNNKSESQLIRIDKITFEQSFMDYVNKNNINWFGEIEMIKLK